MYPSVSCGTFYLACCFGQGRQIWVYYVPTSLSVALLMSILTKRKHLIKNLSNSRAAGRSARISYGGYLYHIVVAHDPYERRPGFCKINHWTLHVSSSCRTFLSAPMSVTIAIARLSYDYIELPLGSLGHRQAR